MKNLIKQIQEQETVSQALEPDLDQRQSFLNKIGEYSNNFIQGLSTAKSYIEGEVEKEPFQISDKTKSFDEIIDLFKAEISGKGLNAAAAGDLGYIPGGGIYAAALGDYLAAISNVYAGVSYASPGAVAVENETINWLKKLFDFPETAVGNLTSGGSIANLIALTAARDAHQIKNGVITKSVIYLSEQAHHCIQKALKIIGLSDVIIRYIELDDQYKIKPDSLQRQIQLDFSEGLNPFLVVATAGTTDVGAIDPLDKIADIAKKNNLWFHVDGAYGGFFIMTSKRDLFKGIEKADSLVVDPHKALFLPYGSGAVLVKDAKAVLHSNVSTGNYLQDTRSEDLAKDPSNVSPELTKHFRGMRMWLPLQLYGIKPFEACLEEKLLLTRYFREKLVELGFKVGPEPDLSVSYFWYPYAKGQNEFNKRLLQNIHEDGRVFMSSTLLHDNFVIRIAIVSFRTKLATIDRGLEMIKECLEKTLREFQ